MPTNNCTAGLQKSLAWCQGTPELPGIKRRLYYIATMFFGVQFESIDKRRLKVIELAD